MLKEIAQLNQLWTDIYYQLRYNHQEKNYSPINKDSTRDSKTG
jgi:hypothetical protein